MERATGSSADENLSRILAEGEGWFSRNRKWMYLALTLVLAGAAAYAWIAHRNATTGARFLSEQARTQKLLVSVSATGNLQPTNQVDVGSELSGIVDQVFVDDNDSVKQGQVIARLDLSRLQDAVAQSRATLKSAEAQVAQAQATAAEAEAQLTRYRQLDRISGGGIPSRSELDAIEATQKRAVASEAAARAAVVQARAVLRSDETNLEKAPIRSPIDGIVLTRSVDPGQTVAAAFQAPVLFTIAEDLSEMELQVDIDEADVGQVNVGQSASFTVDAWPGRTYQAVISRVGYGSALKDGVVSYPAVLKVENADLSLRPGMTGTATITTLAKDNVLVVPNSALRFSPSSNAEPVASGGGALGALLPRPPGSAPKPAAPVAEPDGSRRIWVLRDGIPAPLSVFTGASDGRVTEIIGGELREGMQVITEAVVVAR